MAWSAPTDPVDFAEAIAWFRKRVAISKPEFQRLTARAKRAAFTVAGVAQLDLVHQVWTAIDAALKNGTPLEDFKKTVGEDLRKAWQGSVDEPPWRLETIFRTNVQNAYGAGRYKQATHPDVVGDRPVWMFDAVLDGRETPICRACDGTKRPADDAWWQSHTPPLHFNCRSSFITLMEQQAGKITLTAPTITPADGFGLAPHDGEWEPDEAKYPKQLWLQFADKASKKPPIPPPSRLEVGTHIKELDSKIGETETEALLESVNDAGLLKLLESSPLAKVSIPKTARADGHIVNGWYSRVSGELAVTGDRKPETFGKTFEPGASRTMSSTAKTKEEASRRTFIHELGHHVHLTSPAVDVDDIVKAAFKAAKKFLTKYASVNRKEYFAETFAAYYVDRKALRKYDPDGLKMVEDVLRARGAL